MGKEDYKNEKKGHGFLCVPKELLFDNRYKQLTIEAILLYAYMLDRLKLSIENGWKDSDGKVFIYFSLESIMDLLKCSKGKAISTLKELDEKHGIGLIEKKRSGYGKCSRIYVKEIFELSVSENEKTREKNEEDLEVTNKKHEKSKNKMSRSSKIEPIEVKKINPNNTNKSNTNKSNTKSNHIFRKDMEEKITIEQQIRTNIDYDSLLLTHREDVEQIDEIVNLISEILAKGDKRKIYIAGDMLDCEYVKERFRELNNKHIRCGCGSSGLSAKEMEIRFMRIGIDVDSMTDSDMIKMASVFQNRRSLIFGFSISGEREEVTYLLREAYNKGAKTVLFTTNNGKKFSEYYSEVVALSSLRHLNYGNVISPQFPILIILDIIYAYYVEQNKYIREGMHDSTLCALEE